MSKKGMAGIIFTIVIMIVIFIVAYAFLVQFLDATPERQALRDLKDGIEFVCEQDGPDVYTISVFLPAGNKLSLQQKGLILLERKTSANIFAKILTKSVECPKDTTYSACTVGPTIEGGESVQIEILKTKVDKVYNIALNQTEIVKCAKAV